MPAVHTTIKIEPCEDRTGYAGTRNLKEEATRILVEKVTAANLFRVLSDAPLILTCDIESFVEGSALKRWVLPGSWGGTKAIVAIMVRDVPNDKVLAALRSQSSVTGGGLFSAGADQYILDVAFTDIVAQLEAWTKENAK